MEQYYRTGKYADLEMVILPGGFEDHINVHRVVVCPKSAVLEAYDEMAAKTENPGTITITEPEMQTFLKMIEWMYGIDRDGLLRNNAQIEDMAAEGQHVMANKIRSAADLACIAGEYQVNPLKHQALALINQLVPNLTSQSVVLHAIRHLVPDGVLGTVQSVLVSSALRLVRPQQNAAMRARQPKALEAPPQAVPGQTGQNGLRFRIVDGAVMEEMTSASKENQTINLAALASKSDAKKEEYEFDEPPRKRHRRRTGQSPQKASNDVPDNGPNNLLDAFPRRATLPSATGKRKSALTPGNIAPEAADPERSTIVDDKTPARETNGNESNSAQAKKKRSLGNIIRISTALVPNDPPLGPHCHCHVSADDPYLVQCDGCDDWYHPRCVGKGKYAQDTYNSDRKGYMAKHVVKYAQESKEFKCGDCEGSFFGSK